MLSKYVTIHQRDWDKHLPLLMLAYRSSVQESTGYSPSLMMLGREVQLPIDLLYGRPPTEESVTSHHKYVANFKENMWKIHETARNQMKVASDRQKRHYDHRSNMYQYFIGDPVCLQILTKVKGRSPKLQDRWDGPYLVIKVLSDLVYQIQKNAHTKRKTVHHDRL